MRQNQYGMHHVPDHENSAGAINPIASYQYPNNVQSQLQPQSIPQRQGHTIPCIWLENCQCSFQVSIFWIAFWSSWETIILITSGYHLSTSAIILAIFYSVGTLCTFISICLWKSARVYCIFIFLIVALIKGIMYGYALSYMIKNHVKLYFNDHDISVGVWLMDFGFMIMWFYLHLSFFNIGYTCWNKSVIINQLQERMILNPITSCNCNCLWFINCQTRIE